MSDENDKTVFIQPGNMPRPDNNDRTIMVPNPGVRPTPGGAPNTPPPGMNIPPQTAAMASPSMSDIAISSGLNPLVNAASVILTVSNRLRTTLEHQDIQGLQRQLIDELRQFESAAKNLLLPQEQVMSARYLLCTMLDEIVLNTPWGAASRWGQHSLLSQFHNETGGGEKCFAVLQRMLESPAQHLNVLELFYLCLSLGFQGKFKLDPRGRENLDHISNTLYQTIKNYRGEFEPDLSPNWQSGVASQRSLMQYIPVWVVAACMTFVLLLVFSGFRLWLYQATEPTSAHLNSLIAAEQTDKSVTPRQ